MKRYRTVGENANTDYDRVSYVHQSKRISKSSNVISGMNLQALDNSSNKLKFWNSACLSEIYSDKIGSGFDYSFPSVCAFLRNFGTLIFDDKCRVYAVSSSDQYIGSSKSINIDGNLSALEAALSKNSSFTILPEFSFLNNFPFISECVSNLPEASLLEISFSGHQCMLKGRRRTGQALFTLQKSSDGGVRSKTFGDIMSLFDTELQNSNIMFLGYDEMEYK